MFASVTIAGWPTPVALPQAVGTTPGSQLYTVHSPKALLYNILDQIAHCPAPVTLLYQLHSDGDILAVHVLATGHETYTL